MKNVTITLEQDVLCWAKVWAAGHDTSVSWILSEDLSHRASYCGISVENPFREVS